MNGSLYFPLIKRKVKIKRGKKGKRGQGQLKKDVFCDYDCDGTRDDIKLPNGNTIDVPDLPIAIIILPQLGSSPAIAVLTSDELAIEKAIFFASFSDLQFCTLCKW